MVAGPTIVPCSGIHGPQRSTATPTPAGGSCGRPLRAAAQPRPWTSGMTTLATSMRCSRTTVLLQPLMILRFHELHSKRSVLRNLRHKKPDFRNEVWLFCPNLGRILELSVKLIPRSGSIRSLFLCAYIYIICGPLTLK